MKKCIDLTGMRYGIFTVIKKLSPDKWGNYEWECLCDCGNIFKTSSGRIRSGMTKSCGCLRNGAFEVKHGLSSTHAYKCLIHAKARCYDDKHPAYPDYGGRGIKISDEFLNDVSLWCEYLGNPPDDKHTWTVDRIDTNKNYEIGNIRWLELQKQTRNQRKRSTNTSGVTGVYKHKETGWVAEWWLNYKHYRKYFSFNKYGDEAFRLACEHRAKMIEQLNTQGAGYTDTHGQ